MSEFFAQLGSNIRFPDANINGGGPLPTSLSGPAGVNGDPDSRINFNSELLAGIAPYAYGPGQGRMGADRNYQQIPHRIQKIIPKLYLPYADLGNAKAVVALSHAVDKGDVAFILQSSRVQGQLFDSTAMRDASVANLTIPGHTAFINISTANYILAGLQRVGADTPQGTSWAALARDLGCNYKNAHQRLEMLRLVSTRMLPFGICAGSEKQGGQHETGLAPVQAAANHVTTLTVDGQNRDLVNLWRNVDLSAGDTLIFKLAWLPTQHYTLNHCYKEIVRQSFVTQRCCWQLVPDVFTMSSPLKPAPGAPWPYDYRVNGYWRIGQVFQHRASCEADPGNVFHDTNFLRGQLLQITFAPVWTQFQPLNAKDEIAHARPASPRRTDAGTADADGKKRSFFDAFAKSVSPPAGSSATGLQMRRPDAPRKLGVSWSLAQRAPSAGGVHTGVRMPGALPAAGTAAGFARQVFNANVLNAGAAGLALMPVTLGLGALAHLGGAGPPAAPPAPPAARMLAPEPVPSSQQHAAGPRASGARPPAKTTHIASSAHTEHTARPAEKAGASAVTSEAVASLSALQEGMQLLEETDTAPDRKVQRVQGKKRASTAVPVNSAP